MTVATSQASQRVPCAPARERIQLILNHLDRLPALPGVVARLIAVTSAEDSSARDVVSIIESDAALTAGILRLVRRADLGVRVQSMTVTHAVTMLGMRTVRNAALSSQFFETLTFHGDEAESNLRAGLWEHSLGVACAAELIAQRIGGTELAGEAFICGLLHDIGKIALDVCLPKSYAKAADYAARRHVCISEVENEIFGLDHTLAGKRLAARWQLPQPIQECIWLHHQNADDLPSTIGFAKLVRIVHLADHLVRSLAIGFSGYRHVAAVDELAARLGMQGAPLSEITAKLPERMRPIRELLGLGNPDLDAKSVIDPEVYHQLSQSNARLASENRKLAKHEACLHAVAEFTALVSEQDLAGDVCEAAAQALARLAQAQMAVVYVQKCEGGIIHAGLFDSTQGQGRATVVESVGSSAAPFDFDGFWREVAGRAPLSSLRILPINVDAVQAGVLLERASAEHDLESSDWTCLSRTIGLAMAWAVARSDSESVTQELLDLNRRCREAERELVRMRSISMVGEMAAGAAHELNNPLAVISGRAQMELDLAVEPERRRAMEIVAEQAKKASQIVLDLMAFAKPEAPQSRLQPLSQVLRVASQCWKSAPQGHARTITIGSCGHDLTVYTDAQQLTEILGAIIDNALQAGEPRASHIEINSPSRPSDESVRIVVTDNGPGMTPAVVERAFDPFFSHRPAGRGRGMGLSRAYRLAEINGGRIWIDSSPGRGTTVTIELPSRPPTK